MGTSIKVNYSSLPAELSINNSLTGIPVYPNGVKNINLLDSNGDTVSVDSVSGDDVNLDITPGSVGAKLLKTNQTTSYRTGDDGDIQAGRATDFFTLESNNPFGNTNRFTDELGTQVYANDIVIDWTTYNGSTVLGYYRNINDNQPWNDQIDWALGLSVDTFTSGWRLVNYREIFNIANFDISLGKRIDYPPFNFNSFNNFCTSTTVVNNSSRNYRFVNFTGVALTALKTTIDDGVAVRDFTVTGTTLT